MPQEHKTLHILSELLAVVIVAPILLYISFHQKKNVA
jgi:hypothetical protein